MILVTGANGLLGSNLIRVLLSKNIDSIGTSLNLKKTNYEVVQADLTKLEEVEKIFNLVKPNIVINTVGLTNLETCEMFPDSAYLINTQTAENISKVSSQFNCQLLHISTDHLFDGKRSFYKESDEPSPLNVYAKTKLLGEENVLKFNHRSTIIRTNFFGWSPISHPTTYAEWLYENLKQSRSINVFSDYYFCPIDVISLCEALVLLFENPFNGILNIVGKERISKSDFAFKFAEAFKFSTDNVSIVSGDTISKVLRQKDLSLSIQRFFELFPFYNIPDVGMGLKKIVEYFQYSKYFKDNL